MKGRTRLIKPSHGIMSSDIDALEAEQLYNILEEQVIPEFYDRNEKGIPTRWISRMRESMAQLTPRFSADRTVREYTEQHYLPAAKSYLERTADNVKNGKQLTEKLQNLNQKWDSLHFGEVKVTARENQYKFNVQVFFNDLDPDLVKVELFANGVNGEPPTIVAMERETKSEGTTSGYYYNTSIASVRPVSDYTPRAIPDITGMSVPLETALIIWQH
jgi:glycogen phosphorylase